jgi:hypothetical protein
MRHLLQCSYGHEHVNLNSCFYVIDCIHGHFEGHRDWPVYKCLLTVFKNNGNTDWGTSFFIDLAWSRENTYKFVAIELQTTHDALQFEKLFFSFTFSVYKNILYEIKGN